MVGSVLLDRMRSEGDFASLDAHFFSTSQAGQPGPSPSPEVQVRPLLDAKDLSALKDFEILLSCQGGEYTREVYEPLRESGWEGIWIDAASALRMEPEALIVLDPLNRAQIDAGLAQGKRCFVGGNCTVSLMLMAIAPLLEKDWVQWVSSMTYQAASGSGAAAMRELGQQMVQLSSRFEAAKGQSILDQERAFAELQRAPQLAQACWGTALAGSLIPWIDRPMPSGQSREEWKAQCEANKILGLEPDRLRIDGTCVRIGAMRCHSQGLTIKLRRPVALEEIEHSLQASHPWLKFVANTPEATRRGLSPAALSGSLDVGVGRVRKLSLGDDFLNIFTCGDQLLWGAAEPVRRMLQIALGNPLNS